MCLNYKPSLVSYCIIRSKGNADLFPLCCVTNTTNTCYSHLSNHTIPIGDNFDMWILWPTSISIEIRQFMTEFLNLHFICQKTVSQLNLNLVLFVGNLQDFRCNFHILGFWQLCILPMLCSCDGLISSTYTFLCDN